MKLLNRVYPIIKDNRFSGHLCTEYDEKNKTFLIRYNARSLSKWDFSLILSGVFHEIGHIIQGSMPYETPLEQVYSEWDAEMFSLQMIKKYYTKKDVQEIIRNTKYSLDSKNFKNRFPVHHTAFSQISDYKGTK